MLQHPKLAALSVTIQEFGGEQFLLTSYCDKIIDRML
jgi:hypothetical protein